MQSATAKESKQLAGHLAGTDRKWRDRDAAAHLGWVSPPNERNLDDFLLTQNSAKEKEVAARYSKDTRYNSHELWGTDLSQMSCEKVGPGGLDKC